MHDVAPRPHNGVAMRESHCEWWAIRTGRRAGEDPLPANRSTVTSALNHNWRRTRVHSPISPRGVVCSATDMAMGKLSIYPPTGETRPRGLYFSSSRRRRVMAWAWPSPCAIIPSPAFSTECPSKPRFLPRRQLADLIYPQPLSHAVSAVNLQRSLHLPLRKFYLVNSRFVLQETHARAEQRNKQHTGVHWVASHLKLREAPLKAC